MKNQVTVICLAGLCLVSIVSCLFLYWKLDLVPYGFHVDELSGSVDIGCLATEGVDAHDRRYPLFSNVNYGTPKPPTFIYPGIAWAKIFGYSVPSIRALSVTVFLCGVAGLFFLARLLFGLPCAVMALVTASISPWTWILARVAFESLFSATFMIWGLYFFFKTPRLSQAFLAGLFLAASMYSYPPYRLQTPLMIVSLIVYSFFCNPRTLKWWMVFIGTCFVTCLPLFQKILSGELQNRFNMISIFSKDYLNSIHSSGSLKDMAEIFVHNYLLHFNWNFLFVSGDPSFVHSTGRFGLLSWVDMAALVLAVFWAVMVFFSKFLTKNPLIEHKGILLFLTANILAGVIPSALTNSELPNSLRITCSWPFMCLLNGLLISFTCERWCVGWILVLILAMMFANSFYKVYFFSYPQDSRGMFSYWTLDEANQIKTDEDWIKFLYLYRHQDYNARYFLMQDRHLGCTQTRKMWEGLRDLLISRGTY